jgi:NADH-quinone oxidoreductase subunit G/NADP-reducing hydrogenase subunit HndD
MMGSIIKNYFAKKDNIKPENIYSVAIMPCTAKKFEAQREDMTHKGISDVDAVLTTREFVQLVKLYGIDITKMEPESTDSPMGARTTAGKIFGATGGVMEAALRTAYYKLTGQELLSFKIPEVRGLNGRKETTLNIGGLEINVAVVNGLANAEKLLAEIREGKKQLHFIEVMACPGGCVGGGGQLIGSSDLEKKAKTKSLYDIDEKEAIRVSHKNPEVADLYAEFLGKPLGHVSHELLHTHYSKRDVLK